MWWIRRLCLEQAPGLKQPVRLLLRMNVDSMDRTLYYHPQRPLGPWGFSSFLMKAVNGARRLVAGAYFILCPPYVGK